MINLKKSVMTPLQEMEFLGMVINSKEMTISPKSEITMFRFVSETTSVNFTADEGVRTSYVNNQGCPSSTTEQSLPPTTAGSSLGRKEVISGKHNFERQLKTGTSMVDKKNWKFSMGFFF